MGEHELPTPPPAGQPADQRPSQLASSGKSSAKPSHQDKLVLSDPHPATLTPEPYDSTFVVPPASPKKRGLDWSRQKWLIAISALAIAGLLIGVAWGMLSSSNNGKPITSQTPTVGQQIQTPLPTPTPRPTIVAKTLGNVTVSPARFVLPLECQPDNGFRCTMTLSADSRLFGLVTISVLSPPSGTQVNPSQETLSAGQKKQMIIFIHRECPYEAKMTIFINLQRLDVPLTCKNT